MDKAEYDRRKAQLKAKKDRAGEALQRARGGNQRAYSIAVNNYTAAQEALNDFIKTHGLHGTANGHPPQPTREERRKANLRRRGITPVWDRTPAATVATAKPPQKSPQKQSPKKQKAKPALRKALPESFVRASGESICPTCSKKYYDHPLDQETLDYQDRPFLRILCNGLRVKL